ncbi:phospholipase [Salipaludibacillus keqinensis]|uniref:Phospholipase n=1 Tax=Salipaludibacillus keqinensis TaxID=2045207 RepID=A0A323TI31_9BACI|nr:alpha/beta hydrolase [Salipaludibacillus keqinensis]PYZ93826.1 phospholipase [Salipaludibacillus keqinensis]
MWKWEVDKKKAKGVFVIVHGAGEYHVRYKWVVEKLNQFDFHVIMGDLPGQGTTAGPRGHVPTFDLYINTVSSWLEEARRYDLPVILLGHSMGGLITTRTLMNLDERDLPTMVLLSSPCFGLYNKTPASKKAISYMLNRITPELRFPSNLAPGSGTRDPSMRTRDEQDELLIKKVSIRWYRELEKSIHRAHQEIDTFPEIPLLLMQGGDDRIVDKHSVKQWFDQVDLQDKYYKEWEGLYHEVLNEPEKREVLAHMLGFVTMHLNR